MTTRLRINAAFSIILPMRMAARLRQGAETAGVVTGLVSFPRAIQRSPIVGRIDLCLRVGLGRGPDGGLAMHLRTHRLVCGPPPRRKFGNRAFVGRDLLGALAGVRRSGN